MHGYVLTIDKPGGTRRESISRELADMPFAWEFVEGFRKGDTALDSLYSPLKNLLLSKRSLSAGEIACYAGHRLIWEKIAARRDPYAIVFEDDATIANRAAFDLTLRDVTSAPFDIIKLFDFKPKPVAASRTFGETTLVVHRMIASGMVCYIISKVAARRLLERKAIYRAVDEDLSHAWEFNVQIWSVSPNPVSERALGGSTLEAERARTANRNLLRSLLGEALQFVKKRRHHAYLLKVR